MRRVGTERTALVLSGGGARGAYQAGVIAGIHEVLGRSSLDASPFSLFVGTSVGAINAAFCAAHADRADLGAPLLEELWGSLTLRRHLKIDPLSILWRRAVLCDDVDLEGEAPRRALVDARPFEAMLDVDSAWRRLHDNVDAGRTDGLLMAALQVRTGRTQIFAELAPGVTLRPWGPGRNIDAVPTRIGLPHVMASAAVPLLFPTRRIDGETYCDGGLRFNTPIAPAIRAGATRLVVISLRGCSGILGEPCADVRPEDASNPFFLAGKVMDALLLDPVDHDLQVLERINRILQVIESEVPIQARRRIAGVLRETRGLSYRPIRTLVFAPSQNLGRIAGEALEDLVGKVRTGRALRTLAREVSRRAGAHEADLASFLLFDRRYTAELTRLGREDARARAADIRAFFGSGDAEDVAAASA